MRKRKQKTRKKRVRNKSRCKRQKSRSRLRGGNYAEDITEKEVDGIPVTEDAVITIPGYPSMDADEFKSHAEYMDFQGTRT